MEEVVRNDVEVAVRPSCPGPAWQASCTATRPTPPRRPGLKTLPGYPLIEDGARVVRGWCEGGARVVRGWCDGGATVVRRWYPVDRAQHRIVKQHAEISMQKTSAERKKDGRAERAPYTPHTPHTPHTPTARCACLFDSFVLLLRGPDSWISGTGRLEAG